MVEIDHIFLCTNAGGVEAERLSAFGLTEGGPNTHPGQGTASRRFFFHNAYLELLWVQVPAEAQSVEARPTRLWDRWSGRLGQSCPFGLCLRPAGGPVKELPFASWEYRPSYLPPSLSFRIAKNSEQLTEPMLCYLDFAQRPDRLPSARQQPLNHTAGFCNITRVSFVRPGLGRPSPELQACMDSGLIDLREGDQHWVEIGFDSEARNKSFNFRPALPLLFRW